MPVRYSDHSAGPSTRREGIEWPADGTWSPVIEGDGSGEKLPTVGAFGFETKAELQAALRLRGLPTSGTKAELIERLNA